MFSKASISICLNLFNLLYAFPYEQRPHHLPLDQPPIDQEALQRVCGVYLAAVEQYRSQVPQAWVAKTLPNIEKAWLDKTQQPLQLNLFVCLNGGLFSCACYDQNAPNSLDQIYTVLGKWRQYDRASNYIGNLVRPEVHVATWGCWSDQFA